MTINHIFQWARSQPEKPAFIWNDVSFNYATFWRMLEIARGFFEQQQLPVGHTAIVLVYTLADAWVIVMALRANGLNTVVVESIAQAEALGIKNPACVVLSQGEAGKHQLTGDALAGTKVIMMPAAIFTNVQSGELVFDQRHAYPLGGHILYTSGTTGSNKKIMISGAIQESRNLVRIRSRSLDKTTVQHSVNFPLWTGMGFNQASAVWHAGGCVVFDQRPDKFNYFFRQPITSAALIPAMLKELLKVTADQQEPTHAFRLVFIGGFLPIRLAEQASRQLTKRIEILYSSTELGNYALYAHFNGLDDLHWMLPESQRMVQVVDENGVECPVGEEGELRILLTDIDSSAYLDDEETSARFFRDGFFYPGDMAVTRADGRIHILGRVADVLNVDGIKMPVAPMERTIQRLLAVDEVCLFSGLNDMGIDELVIAIQSDRELKQTDKDAIRREFLEFEHVRFVVLKEFPRTTGGMQKLQRSALRKLVF